MVLLLHGRQIGFRHRNNSVICRVIYEINAISLCDTQDTVRRKERIGRCQKTTTGPSILRPPYYRLVYLVFMSELTETIRYLCLSQIPHSFILFP